jgi:poly(beta-D-mannuronate) lyase
MADPTLSELAARLAVVEQRLGITPAPDPKPATRFPADVFGKSWYLTVPVKDPDDGWAMEIEQPTLAQYTSKFCELSPDGTAAVFRVWHGGVTTSGSKNPRTELREQTTDGLKHASWSSKSGRHRMAVAGQVNRLTKVRPHVVIGQIHSSSDDVTVFRVEGNKLWITKGDEPHGYLLDSAFQLGKRYEIGFDVSGGVVSYFYNGQLVPFTLKAGFTGAYFKAGAYLQSNPTSAPSESTEEYAEVVITSATVTHS